RSEDARARLLALTEFPEEWARFVTAARRLNRRHRRQVTGEMHPDGLTEYYLYQTLVASWTDDQGTGEYADRICEHMTKAMREAKLATNWILPREDIEEEVHRFTRAILDRRNASAFLRRLRHLVAVVSPAADVKSLSLLWLKCFAPGIPDIYQGM